MSAMHYVGGGSFYIGVPARDLTAEEAALYSEVVAESPLYTPAPAEQPVEQPAPQSAPADESSEGE